MTTTTDDERAFLAAIASAPDDDTARLVFADWLDDHSQHERAKLTRDLCRLHAGEDVEPYPADVEALRSVAAGFFPRRARIDSLTGFERSLMPWFRQAWLAAGLRAQPCGRAACEAAADLAYERAGLPPPKLRVWLSGPLHGAVGAAMLAGAKVEGIGDQVWSQVGSQVWSQVWSQVRDQVWDQVQDQVWSQVWSQVGSQVRDQVRDQVWDQVQDQVWSQVWSQVGSQVRDQVWDQVQDQVWDQVQDQVWSQVGSQVWSQVQDQVWSQVRDQVWSQVGSQVGSQVRDQRYRCGYGQQDAGWLAFYAYFSAAGLTACDRLAGLFALAACGWWWPFAGAVILTERPTMLEMARGKLRVIEYADGLRVDRRPADREGGKAK